MSGESNDEKSWNEIKIAREIWPPDIEEILFHYKKAEIIDPKYYQIYKDRARLYYVLGEIEKSKQEYLKWCNLDSKWIEEVDKEVNSREKYRNKNIHPWVRLQKFLEYGEEKVVEKVNTNFELEKIRKKQRNKEKYERKKQSEIRRREEEKISSQKFIGNLNKKKIESITDEENNSDYEISLMYNDQFDFEIIVKDIKDGKEITKEIISKRREAFKDYFKYLEEKDENEVDNFQKLYEFAKMKYEDENEFSFEELINMKNSEFIDFYLKNKEYLEKWRNTFCELFIIFYQHLHQIPIEVKKDTDFLKNFFQENILENSPQERIEKPIEERIEKQIPENEELFSECETLIENWKRRTISENNANLMDFMINAYENEEDDLTLKEICMEAGISETSVRENFRSIIRVPKQLRDLVENDRLISDPLLSREIALYATDYFLWDKGNENEDKVILFANMLAECFKNNLHLRKEFFATNDDYSKPVSENTKKNNELNAILEDYPIRESKREWSGLDRTGKQYRFIVFYSKDLDAARFVRRWEYEKEERISKIWASEIIDQIKNKGSAKEFVKENLFRFEK